MNEGWLAMALVLSTIAVGVYASMRPDLFFPARHPSAQRRPGPARHSPARRRLAPPARKPTEIAKPVSPDISGAAMPNSEHETIALETLAILVSADLVGETDGLKALFGAKAGSSKKYKAIHARFKEIQGRVESSVKHS